VKAEGERSYDAKIAAAADRPKQVLVLWQVAFGRFLPVSLI
jgi:hypothetical protein